MPRKYKKRKEKTKTKKRYYHRTGISIKVSIINGVKFNARKKVTDGQG